MVGGYVLNHPIYVYTYIYVYVYVCAYVWVYMCLFVLVCCTSNCVVTMDVRVFVRKPKLKPNLIRHGQP
jgi:hypothetical protein